MMLTTHATREKTSFVQYLFREMALHVGLCEPQSNPRECNLTPSYGTFSWSLPHCSHPFISLFQYYFFFISILLFLFWNFLQRFYICWIEFQKFSLEWNQFSIPYFFFLKLTQWKLYEAFSSVLHQLSSTLPFFLPLFYFPSSLSLSCCSIIRFILLSKSQNLFLSKLSNLN